MDKRGVALIFTFFVVIVLSILLVGFFLKSVNENRMVIRHINSMQAFWVAEAGIAQAIADLPTQHYPSPLTQTLGTPPNKFNYSVTSNWISSRIDPITGDTINIYQLDARGSVTNTDITRDIQTFVSFTPPTIGGFNSAIEVKNTLKILGAAIISGGPKPPYWTDAENHEDLTFAKDKSSFNFQQRFDIAPEEVKAYARSKGHYFEDPNPSLPQYAITNPLADNMADAIYWVKITDSKKQLQIPKTGWQGNNVILIVEGNCDVEGGTFSGILWVMGELKIAGNTDINGAVLSEDTTDITSVTGKPDLYYDPVAISKAGGLMGDLGTRAIVAWREAP